MKLTKSWIDDSQYFGQMCFLEVNPSHGSDCVYPACSAPRYEDGSKYCITVRSSAELEEWCVAGIDQIPLFSKAVNYILPGRTIPSLLLKSYVENSVG